MQNPWVQKYVVQGPGITAVFGRNANEDNPVSSSPAPSDLFREVGLAMELQGGLLGQKMRTNRILAEAGIELKRPEAARAIDDDFCPA